MLERIERAPLHAVIDSLTKPQPPAMDEYLRCDFNSLQVWDMQRNPCWPRVLYLPDKHLSYACYLLVVPRFFEEVRTHFPRFFWGQAHQHYPVYAVLRCSKSSCNYGIALSFFANQRCLQP